MPERDSTELDRNTWYAACAWDALGVPAMLAADAIIDTWCRRKGLARGAAISVEVAWGLARCNRLDAGWARPTKAEAEALLARLGLDSECWRL